MSTAPTTLSKAQTILTDLQAAVTAISKATGQAIAAGATKTTIVLNDIVTVGEAAAEIVDPPVASLVVGGVDLVEETGPGIAKLLKSIF